MKYLAITLLMAMPAMAQQRTPEEAYAKASGAYSAATGAMVLGNIEVNNGIGLGIGNISGHTVGAIKLGVPLGEHFTGTLGFYHSIEEGQEGYAIGITWEW